MLSTCHTEIVLLHLRLTSCYFVCFKRLWSSLPPTSEVLTHSRKHSSYNVALRSYTVFSWPYFVLVVKLYACQGRDLTPLWCGELTKGSPDRSSEGSLFKGSQVVTQCLGRRTLFLFSCKSSCCLHLLQVNWLLRVFHCIVSMCVYSQCHSHSTEFSLFPMKVRSS